MVAQLSQGASDSGRIKEFDASLLKFAREAALALNSLPTNGGFWDTGLTLREFHDQFFVDRIHDQARRNPQPPSPDVPCLSYPQIPIYRNTGLFYLLVSLHEDASRLRLIKRGGCMRVYLAESQMAEQALV